MPPDWDDDFWQENSTSSPFESSKNKKSPNRPPLYNAEDYTIALKQLFTSHINHHHIPPPASSLLIETTTRNGSSTSYPEMMSLSHQHLHHQEMSMKNFLNGSELLFKLEADLRHAYPTFVQEFVSGHCEGVSCLLESLKSIQTSLDECGGIREQRKLISDEQKCLQCVKLCLRNIEAVSKLSAYPGGLYPLATAMISTVTNTRILALEIFTCLCLEGGSEGHYKVSEAVSTLRLRLGEPIRCKLLIGAISSAPPGTFQAKGIRFLTAFVASAPSPKHKVHIQCELEEAGFHNVSLRKGAETGGARESAQVLSALDDWDRVSIDVDTLSRQNCQLRNSVATLQQELATLKDKLKRMDVSQKSIEDAARSKRSMQSVGNMQPMNMNNGKRTEEMVSTPVDSEEEAEQIHQILEDLHNIVNSEMDRSGESYEGRKGPGIKKEKEIVPVHLVKTPPKRPLAVNGSSNETKGGGGGGGVVELPNGHSRSAARPWPGSSASDDDDSDIVELCQDVKPSVKKVVEQLENMEKSGGPSPKFFQQQRNGHPKIPNGIGVLPMSMSMNGGGERTDYPNFHKSNHMASKFANFKSSKLQREIVPEESKSSRHCSSNSYAEVYEKSSYNSNKSNNSSSNRNNLNRFSPNLGEYSPPPQSNMLLNKKNNGSTALRRSESLHASLASIEMRSPFNNNNGYNNHNKNDAFMQKSPDQFNKMSRQSRPSWKSMENLENEQDENFTLRWRYPTPPSQFSNGSGSGGESSKRTSPALTPSPKSGKTGSKAAAKLASSRNHHSNDNGNGELCSDYRQSRFAKNKNSSSGNGSSSNHNSGGISSSPLNIFSRKGFSKKNSSSNHNGKDHSSNGNKDSKLFSLPPILMSPQEIANNHRICDLPSGLY